jgi:Zn-finger nucleic acid-binding protein
MKCSKCGNDLTRKNLEGVEIDECTKCGGIWFDEDELRKAKDNKDADLNWLDFDVLKSPQRINTEENIYKCPKCNVNMEKIKYDKSNIIIDYCPSCRGIWLDKGEFGLIIEYLTKELLNKSKEEYFKEVLKQGKEIFTGKEGFISEWKDFITVARFMLYRINAERISKNN